MELTTIIWMFVLGLAIALVVMYYNSRFLGRFVRALIKIDATAPETAITPEELGVKITPAIRYALRPETSFAQTVLKTEDGRYFIAPDRLALAKVKYRAKDATIGFVLVSLVIIGLVALAVTMIFPDILDGVVAQFSELFGSSEV